MKGFKRLGVWLMSDPKVWMERKIERWIRKAAAGMRTPKLNQKGKTDGSTTQPAIFTSLRDAVARATCSTSRGSGQVAFLPGETFQAWPSSGRRPWGSPNTLEGLCLLVGLGAPWGAREWSSAMERQSQLLCRGLGPLYPGLISR